MTDRLRPVIEEATRGGVFGEGLAFEDLVLTDDQGEDHFASDVIFASVKLKNRATEESVKVDIVAKKQKNNAFVRDNVNSDVQFFNESLMYQELLPFIDSNGIVSETFPKFVYGLATLGEDPDQDLLIAEDLRQAGFRLTEEKVILDFDHCSLALKKLGRFHALSYAMKQKNLDEYLEKVSELKESQWNKDQSEEFNKYLTISMERGVLPLLSGEHAAILAEFLDRDPAKMMQEFCRPEEPMAVLCHGDFCRNNMVFLYDDSGRPTDLRLFDVATARYASPAIDLAFFLFLNTSPDMRRSRWNDLLRSYHDSLSSAVPGCRVPSLGVVHTELGRKAAYGYVLCSFFLPAMMDTSKMEVEDFASMKPEELDALMRNRGGEEGTALITDIVKDLIRLNSLYFLTHGGAARAV